jgi:predicted transcriptional regulator of viral defense system
MANRSLSPTEARVILALEARRQERLDLGEVPALAGISRGFARKLVHGLARKGWLQRVRRGRYLVNPGRNGPEAVPDSDPFRFGRSLVAPYYFGFATAAELWGMLPQASRVYYVVTPSPERPSPSGPAEYHIAHVLPERFFGHRRLRRRGGEVRVSDRERTVIDSLLHPEFSGGLAGVVQMLSTGKRQLDWGRVRRYLLRLNEPGAARRLGYLAERVRPELPAPAGGIAALRPPPRAPPIPLGSPRQYGSHGPIHPRWRIVENVPEGELFAEVDIR